MLAKNLLCSETQLYSKRLTRNIPYGSVPTPRVISGTPANFSGAAPRYYGLLRLAGCPQLLAYVPGVTALMLVGLPTLHEGLALDGI